MFIALAQTLQGITDKIVSDVVNPLIGFLMAAATLVFIWGVVQFMTNTADAEGRSSGRNHIIWGIVGLVIMVSVFGIMNLVADIFK